MQVEITITDDNGEVTTKKADLNQWKITLREIKLLSAVVNRPLANTCLGCMLAGLATLTQEYGRTSLELRKAELRTFIRGE